MWAPTRRTAPPSPLPVAVNRAQKHVLADLQAVGDQGRAGVVAQLRPGTVELAADVGAEQADRAAVAAAGGGEPAGQEHVLVDLQAVREQGGAGVVAQLRPAAVELAADVGAGQADRAEAAAAGSGEPAAEVHVLVDLQAVRRTGRGRSRCAAPPRRS